MTAALRYLDYAVEKRCTHCKEWWPLDYEFFRPLSNGRRSSWCRACERDEAGAKRATQRAAKLQREAAHG